MARSLWSGNISFGLVNIPVSVVSAESQEQHLDFDLVDKRDKARVGFQKINKNTGEVVEQKNIVKALKLKGGDYALFDTKELGELRIKGSSSIDIQQCIEKNEVSPLLFERPYYLLPGKNGEKTYVLLRETLKKTNKYAVGLIVMHFKQHVALIGVEGPALTLNLIRFAENIRDPSEYDLPKEGTKSVKITPKEISMAEKLIEELSAPWNPDTFKDTYHKEIMDAVKHKTKSKLEETQKEEESTEALSKVLDLMPLLERSLKANKKKGSRTKIRHRHEESTRSAS